MKGEFEGRPLFQISLIDSFLNLEMNSSDEDFLPDPEGPKRRKAPPDRGEASGSKGKKRKIDESDNQQSGLYLRDDFSKGRCIFIILSELL